MPFASVLIAAALLQAPPSTSHEHVRSIEIGPGFRSFAIAVDDRILAGREAVEADAKPRIEVLDPTGRRLESWELPITPEAMAVDALGLVYVAGEGELLKLDAKGREVLRRPAPHAAALDATLEEFREQTRAQIEMQQKAIDQQLEQSRKEVERLEATPADQRSPQQAAQLEQARGMLEALEEYLAQNLGDVDAQVRAMTAQQRAASSICVAGDDVFVTTRTINGYTYDVWRTDPEFQAGQRIVEGLSGCCGQMDVQCDGDTLFVAENGRHRVSRYDREGTLIGHFGRGDRTGEEGFLGCCNPMNLAFDQIGLVYAAEADGRILRFSADGRALGQAGEWSMPGGCKNASIRVSDDGRTIHLFDLNRRSIQVLAKRPAQGQGG